MTTLPEGWAEFCIADVGGTVGGKTPSKAEPRFWEPGEVPWASPKDMKAFRLIETQDRLAQLATVEAGMVVLPAGTVLMVTRSGILAHTFPVAITGVPTTINQDVKAVIPGPLVEPRYLAYCLRSKQAEILGACSKAGTTVASVETNLLERLPLPLAPAAEQQRIADKLDALLARVDACRERIDRVPAILKRFRQAVLAAATSGELTREWRAKHGLDDEWPVVALADVASDFSYGSGAKSAPEGRVPVLRMGNIQEGRLDWNDLVYTSDATEIERYRLEPGDVLFNRTNSPELVGKTAVFLGEREAIHAGYLIRVKCGPTLLPQFLNYCLGSPAGRDYCWQVKTDGVSQSNINAKKLAAFTFGLPTVDEQREVIKRVDALLALHDELVERLAMGTARVEQLTPAILAKAFRGELVPQDSDDEPAAVLLGRIRAERGDAAAQSGRGRRAKVPVGVKP